MYDFASSQQQFRNAQSTGEIRGLTSQQASDTELLEQINGLEDDLGRFNASVRGGIKSIRPSVVKSARTGSEEVVRMMICARAGRFKVLPATLFADPAWDMLLDLYLADILSKRVSVSSLCGASNVPATTALRWIGHLTDEGLVERSSDPYDARRYFISLSEAGLARMDRYFEALPRHVAHGAR
jgi:hypothetical protein